MRALMLSAAVVLCGCPRTTVLGAVDGGPGRTALAITGTVCTPQPFVLRALFVQPLSAAREPDGWKADGDGDGLSDSAEGSTADTADRDSDGFDDLFETLRADAGFDPNVKDARGCDPSLGCVPTDADGDGLSEAAERWLGTLDTRVDSDADGIPDGLEVRAGLDPAAANTGDLDGDTASDAAELVYATDPTRADDPNGSPLKLVVQWTLLQETQATRCYDVLLDNLPMQARLGQRTVFKIWRSVGPASGAHDQDLWTTACAMAYRNGGEQMPASLVLDGLNDDRFQAPAALRVNQAGCLVPPEFATP